MGKKEEMLKQAVQKEYLCNGKHACTERAYCRFCEGNRSSHECDYECYAEEFALGFEAGWSACIKHLGEIPWDQAMNEIVKNKEQH